MKTVFKTVFALGAVVLATPALAQSNLEQCGSYPTGQSSYACICAAGGSDGSVWGSGPYTADSDLCTAARHAGAIKSEGGPVLMARVAGQDSYQGSTRNGVTTSDWGPFADSVQFMTQAASVQQCGRFDAAQSPLTCSCPPANMRNGSVWGSSPFTTDSDICTAAQFDGMIEADGGMVTLLAVQGLQSYAGESRNGVTSSAWGSYQNSFVFDWNQP